MVLMKLNVTVKHRHILTVVNFILKKKGKKENVFSILNRSFKFCGHLES